LLLFFSVFSHSVTSHTYLWIHRSALDKITSSSLFLISSTICPDVSSPPRDSLEKYSFVPIPLLWSSPRSPLRLHRRPRPCGIWVSVSSCTPIALCTHYRSIDPPSSLRYRPPVATSRRLLRYRRCRRRRRRRHADASLSVSHRSSYLGVHDTWRIMVGLLELFDSSKSLFQSKNRCWCLAELDRAGFLRY